MRDKHHRSRIEVQPSGTGRQTRGIQLSSSSTSLCVQQLLVPTRSRDRGRSGGPPPALEQRDPVLRRGRAGSQPRLCDPRQSEESCGTFARDEHGLERYAGEAGGPMPFFDCFRWRPFDESGRDVVGLDPVFDYDVSSIGFPLSLKRAYRMELNGRWADPGFIAPERGDFRLKPGAVAATSSCRVQDRGDGVLTCGIVTSETSFAGALTSTGDLYAGPASERFRPPPH